MTSWEPVDRNSLIAIVDAQLAECSEDQRGFFEEHRLDFYQVPIRRLGAVDAVFVVAKFGSAVLYFKGVEEGFGLAELDESGTIASHSCSQFQLRHVLERLRIRQSAACIETRNATFGQNVFAFLTTIVPYWRMCDDAWLLSDESHLRGIGVLRNYGGDVLIIPWSKDPELLRCLQLPRMGNALPDYDRRIVVVDDRSGERWDHVEKGIFPIAVIPWSDRSRLSEFVISDAP
jgi:hypothetical protein